MKRSYKEEEISTLIRLYSRQLSEYESVLTDNYSLRELRYIEGAIMLIHIVLSELIENNKGIQFLIEEYQYLLDQTQAKIKAKENSLKPIEKLKLIKNKNKFS